MEFEYRVISLSSQYLTPAREEKLFNEMGAKGWRLVTIYGKTRALFERSRSPAA